VATGAGAGAMNAIGTGVLGGMVTATVLVIIFTPLFFVLVETLIGKGGRGHGTSSGGVFAGMGDRISGIRERFTAKGADRRVTGTEKPRPSED